GSSLPLRGRAPARDSTAGRAVLLPFSAIEIEAADVLRILKHQVNRFGPPIPPWPRRIEQFGDGLFAMPGAEEPENLSHNVRFLGYDRYAVADSVGISTMVGCRGFVEDRFGTEAVRSPSR